MGVVIASLLAATLSTALYGSGFWRLAPSEDRPALLLAFFCTLPMCVLVFYGVRLPLKELIDPVMSPSMKPWLNLIYAPLTEEPAKLIPLLIPAFRPAATPANAVRIGYALGLGFGVGEIGLIAWFSLQNPTIAVMSWWMLGGLITERFFVCLIHGLFTSMVLCGWKRWGYGLAGGLVLAMLLHLLGNAPIVVAPRIPWLSAYAGLLIFLWVIGLWFAALWFYSKYRETDNRLRSLGELIFGKATCPKCEMEYPRPLFGLNLGPKRYERCPHCRRWNLL